jgi:two-component system phosphate regulon sensor histidine kinase PhoR
MAGRLANLAVFAPARRHSALWRALREDGQLPTLRFLIPASMAAAAFVAAVLFDANAVGAAVALLGGIAAAALAIGRRREIVVPQSVPRAPEKAPAAAVEDLIEAIEDPLLLVEGDQIVAANAPARALFGEHVAGADVRLVVRHPAAAERLARRPEDEDAAAERVEIDGLGGIDRQWAMSVTPLAGDRRFVRFADLSQVRAAEKIRADFVANASHELRTPLATLIGFLETLGDEESAPDPATRRRFLQIMSEQATRMRALIDDLMSLSRIEADRYAAPDDEVDLVTLIDSVVRSLEALSLERRSPILVDNFAGSSTIRGDRVQLAQLLTNLLTNALNYGRHGTPVRVKLSDGRRGMFCLEVVDEGEGIAAEHLPRLTERFYRVDAGRSRSVGGTGLGLAIAKHIALRHGGRLEIASRQGQGTRARVFLPRARLDPVIKASRN